MSKIPLVLKRQQIAKQFYPKSTFIQPLIVGVKKESIGTLTAGKLMLAVLNKYKQQQLPVIIDTVTDYNVRLYQKLGFKRIGKDNSLGYTLSFLRMN